jgi:hypothetical protein
VESLPNLENITAARGLPLGEKYAALLIECLTSSKSETRSAALSLLDASVENEIVALESIKKATDRLKPALQRSVGPLIAKMAKKAPLSTRPETSVPINASADGLPKPLMSGDTRQRTNGKEQSDFIATRIPERRTNDFASSSPPKSSITQPKHPLVSESGKHVSAVSRSIIWTEYPEEPHGSLLENLKRSWAPLLPAATVSAIFPNSGIRKQDDAKAGIETLTRALSIDRSSRGTSFVEHLDFILKWMMFVLCSKESTTGLQDILALWKDILAFLIEIERELTDSEALENVPFLLDKASSAKV